MGSSQLRLPLRCAALDTFLLVWEIHHHDGGILGVWFESKSRRS